MKHRTKLFVALAGSAVFASLVVGLAVASGTKAGGATVGVAKSSLGRILVDSRGITLYDRKPGQTTGQGLNQFGAPWWVLSPAGKEIHRG